jgi:predicted DNA-binding transcriptional regulator AlpA
MSRPTAVLAETRATRRAVAALEKRVAGLIVAVEQLRGAAPSRLGHAEDACRVLGISRTSLWRGVKSGTIPCERIGKRGIRFDLAALTTTHEARS